MLDHLGMEYQEMTEVLNYFISTFTIRAIAKENNLNCKY